MKKEIIIKSLIRIANNLDIQGYYKEANQLTKIAQMFPEDFPEYDPKEQVYDYPIQPDYQFDSNKPIVKIISLDPDSEKGIGASTEDMIDLPGVIDERRPGGMFEKMNKKYTFVYDEEEEFDLPDETTGPLKIGMTVMLDKVKHMYGWAVLKVLKTSDENQYDNFSNKKFSSKKKINLTPKLTEYKFILSQIDSRRNIKTADKYNDRAQEYLDKFKNQPKLQPKIQRNENIDKPDPTDELVAEHNLNSIGIINRTKRYFYFKKHADKLNVPLLNFVSAFFPSYYREIAEMENSISPPVPIPEQTEQERWEAGKREDEEEFERTRQSIEWELKLDKFAEEKSQELNMSKEDFIKVYLPSYQEWLNTKQRKIKEKLQNITLEVVKNRLDNITDEYADEESTKISNFDFDQLVENAGLVIEKLGEAIEPLSKRAGEVFQGVIHELSKPNPILQKTGKTLKVLLSFFDPNALQQAMDEMANDQEAREKAERELDDFLNKGSRFSASFISSNYIKYNF